MDKEELISFVNEIAHYHDEGLIPYALHLPGGNEDELIDIFSNIQKDDYIFCTHRNMYHALLHGIDPTVIRNKILNARSMFMYSREHNFFTSAIIGGTVAIAAGVAAALKRKGSRQRVYCFVGDGTEDSGHFAEAARYVDGHNLPCTFIIEDNGHAVDALKKDRWGTEKDIDWYGCVRRYHYKLTRPHIRTGNFAPLDVMAKIKKQDNEYFTEVTYPCYKNTLQSSLSYKDAVKEAMTKLGKQKYVFLGYSITPGDAMGTLVKVPNDQKIEMPVAENLMVGMAIGMSLEGICPVVYFERHDFMLCAADAIGNHLDKITQLSDGQFKTPVILKTVVDDGGLFYSGPTHSQNFTDLFRRMVKFPVIDAHAPSDIASAYSYASMSDHPVMVVEHKKYF